MTPRPRLAAWGALMLAAAFGLLAGACGGAPAPPAAAAPSATPAPLHVGPLTDYVSAAGLRWLVVAEPKRLAAEPGLLTMVETLVPRVRREAFRETSGVDLEQLDAGLIAGFDYGQLYLAQLRDAALVEQRFVARLVSEPDRRSSHPHVRRVTGVVGATPTSLVVVDEVLVGVSVADVTPARVVELFALERLKRSPPALQGAALSTLPRELDEAPLRAYAPGPFQGEWLDGARGLLAVAEAVGLGMELPGDDRLLVSLWLSGDWDAVGPDATARLLGSWEDLAGSSLGSLLGLTEPLAAPIVATRPGLLRLTVELRLAALLKGVHGAVGAEVWELLDLRPPQPPSPAPAPPAAGGSPENSAVSPARGARGGD